VRRTVHLLPAWTSLIAQTPHPGASRPTGKSVSGSLPYCLVRTDSRMAGEKGEAMRRLLAAILCLAALFTVAVTGALAGNPSPTGTGQPSQSCQDGTAGPPGIFSMNNGFANTAVNVYANPKTLPNGNEINAKAVSQYDVACYQVRTH
jgi:hypothetical protein